MKAKTRSVTIILSTSMAIFTLAASFISSMAWFSASRNVKANGSGFEVSKENSILDSIEIHTQKEGSVSPFIFNEEAKGKYVFADKNSNILTYQPATEGEDKKIDIGTYSVTDSQKALLLVYNFRQDQSEDRYHLTLKAATTTAYKNSLLALDSNSNPINLISNSNNLSSIISFSAFEFGNSYDLSTKTRTFSSFANYSSTGTTYEQTLSLYKRTGKRKSLALVITYNSDIIEYLYSLNLSNPVLNNDVILFDKTDFVLSL